MRIYPFCDKKNIRRSDARFRAGTEKGDSESKYGALFRARTEKRESDSKSRALFRARAGKRESESKSLLSILRNIGL